MKNFYVFILALINFTCFSQIITIPDANFKAKLTSGNNAALDIEGTNYNSKVDTNNDGEIQLSEALAVKGLNISHIPVNPPGNIFSLEGLENFTNLKHLILNGNQVTGTLDLSMLQNLETLNCAYNNISVLNVSGLSQLESIKCYNNNLSDIVLEDMTSLEILSCYNNNLTSLDFEEAINLKSVSVRENNFTNLDVTMLSNLETLICSVNEISNLDVTGLSNLTDISASGNDITSINLSGLNSLSHLDLSYNLIPEIDLSLATQIKLLFISSNPIVEINLTENSNLEYLEINNTQVSEIDCSQTSVFGLQASNNPNLTSINVKNGVISTSDPDMLFYAFWFENLPILSSICIDDGEQSNLAYTNYNMNGNATLYMGENCDIATVPSGLDDNKMVQYNIYPNPASSVLYIENATIILNQKLEIYNTLGQLVKVVEYSNHKLLLNISDFEAGTYIIKIFGDNFTSTQKFIKM